MLFIKKIEDLKAVLTTKRGVGKTVGLVPTMGALHQGHLSLMERSSQENDCTVVSIFVNPIQFNNSQDLDNYPSNMVADVKMLEAAKVDIVFAPARQEVYPKSPLTRMTFSPLDSILEGAFRDNHFSGVGVVVSKLFNIVGPNKAYFGQKDLQQYLIIKQLVTDLNFPIELVCAPIVRDDNGLALSSRNQRLSDKGIKQATVLSRILKMAEQKAKEGVPLTQIKKDAAELCTDNNVQLEYIEFIDTGEFCLLKEYKGYHNLAICIAGYVEDIRLIDNILIQE